MLTTIIYSISASEQVVDVTAVEARACARGRVREDREWSIYSENHATGTYKTKTRGSRLGSPYYYIYYYLTLVVVGVVPVIVVEVEPGGVVDFMPHASNGRPQRGHRKHGC